MLEIGSRLELFVDRFIVDRLSGVELRLQRPVWRNVAIRFDAPWEGNTSGYVAVFRDGDRCRMYYRGSQHDVETKELPHEQVVCYAESTDGITWTKPELGLFEFEGSGKNNIVWMGPGSHNFAPFKDANPDCTPDAQYKALGQSGKALVPFKSSDGLHWSLIRGAPVITEGKFDSQNLAFWDSVRGRYVDFHRMGRNGVRDIMTCTSDDFLNWTDPVWLDYRGAPPEQLYTNATVAYYRAPHVFMAFPKRFVTDRKKVDEHPNMGLSDGLFMTSRDGVHWHRWREAFIRPGLLRERWVQRNNMTAWGMLVTRSDMAGTPDELSLFSSEAYYQEGARLRRCTLRIDGFVAASAPAAGGEIVTKPLVFEGRELVINYATSAAGSVRVELADEHATPIPGFVIGQCPPIYGDEIEKAVAWAGQPDLSALAGKPVRLRFVLRDADLFSMRFRP